MKIKTINLKPFILKEKDTYIKSNTLEADIDKIEETITPPYDITALKQLRYSSIHHRKCIKAKAIDTACSGWSLNPTQDNDNPEEDESFKTLYELFNDYDFEDAFFRALEDYITFGYAAVEILENKLGEVRGFKHIRANTIRMCKGGEKAVQKYNNQKVYFKVLGTNKNEDLHFKTGKWYPSLEQDIRATRILWFNSSNPDSDYYGEPEYLPSLYTILSDEKLREYNKNGLESNGVPNYIITITGNFNEGDINPETNLSEFEEAFEESFKNLQNKPGEAIVFTIPSEDSQNNIKINIERVSDEIKDSSFEKFRESNMYEILEAHEVPPQRLGINPVGQLGGNISKEINEQYNQKTIGPLQRLLEHKINKLVIKDLMGIESFELSYRGVDNRDILLEMEIALKLLLNGAMTPAEFRNTFGDYFNLEIIEDEPALEEFYINNNPITSNPEPDRESELILKRMEDRLVKTLYEPRE